MEYLNKYKNGSKLCISKNRKLGRDIDVVSRLGGHSTMGEAYKACDHHSKNCFAIKVIPKDSKSKEIKYLEQVSTLVKDHVVPGLPVIYKHFVCDKCKYRNPELLHKPKKCEIIANKIQSGTLKQWLIKRPKINDILIAYFQIFSAVYCIWK